MNIVGSVRQTVKPLLIFANKHLSEILIGLGGTGLITSNILTAVATVKAVRIIDLKKQELGVEQLSSKDIFKYTWKCFIPSTSVIVGSLGALVGSAVYGHKQKVALASTIMAQELTNSDIKEAAKEVVGEKKMQQIEEKAAEKKLDRELESSNGNPFVLDTGFGTQIFLEPNTGQFFRASCNYVDQCKNEFVKCMNDDLEGKSLNEWLDILRLEPIKDGDIKGFPYKINDPPLDIRYGADKRKINGEEVSVLVLIYSVDPVINYDLDELY